VPQVRPSVPGTKKMGEAQRSLFAELVSSPAMTQTPDGTGRLFRRQPRTASWATFSRPSGRRVHLPVDEAKAILGLRPPFSAHVG
jgi:hypothetical protein